MPSLVVAICCFKGDRYQWFDLPEPMMALDAREYAMRVIGTPPENIRYQSTTGATQ